jgi:hypothetical protein
MSYVDDSLRAALRAAHERQSQAREKVVAAQASRDRGAARSNLAQQRQHRAERAMAEHQSELAAALQDSLRSGEASAGAPLTTDEDIALELVRAQAELTIARLALAGLESEHAEASAALRAADRSVLDAENEIIAGRLLGMAVEVERHITEALRIAEELTDLAMTLEIHERPGTAQSLPLAEVQRVLDRARPLTDKIQTPVDRLRGVATPRVPWAERRAALLADEAA